MSKQRVLVAIATFGFVLFSTTAAMADPVTEEFDATIEVIANLGIDEMEMLDFGVVGKPTEGTETLTLDSDSNAAIGGDAFVVDGTANAGIYEVSGNPEDSVFVESDVVNDFNATGVSLLSLDIEDQGETHTIDMENGDDGTKEIAVGGAVEIDSEADEGEHQADIELTVSYE